MLYVFQGLGNDASVVLDATGLTDEQKSRAIQIEELPIKEINDLMPVLKCEKSTGEVWYEYVTAPVTENDNKREIDLMKAAIDELIMNAGGF